MAKHEDEDKNEHGETGIQQAMSTPNTSSDDIGVSYDVVEGRKARRKVDFTVLPLLFVGLFVFQLDRMNLGSALTAGFAQDIKITQSTVNAGNQLMFAMIVIFEIPSNMILQRVGPRIYMPLQVLAFGLVATMQSVVTNRTGFLLVKVFLGITEGGYIPGGAYTLSTWYTRKELAKRIALFFFGMFGGNALSPLLGAGIIRLEGRQGLRGWQWIFLLEGIFTIVIALVMLFFLPGSPEHPAPLFKPFARFSLIKISSEDGKLLQARIAAEHPDGKYHAQHLLITPGIVWKTVTHWRRLPHLLSTSLVFSTWSPLTTYTPSIMLSLGFTRVEANALASVGAFLALGVVFFFAWISDRSQQRGLAVFLGIVCYLVTLVAAKTGVVGASRWGRWGLWTAVNAFAVGYHPSHNTWLQLNCRDPRERSVSIALWVMFAITGLMYGTQYFQGPDAPTYEKGLTTMIGVVSAGAFLVIVQEIIYWDYNRKVARRNERVAGESGKELGYVM